MNKLKKNHLYCCVTSLAFMSFAQSVWGMNEREESENRVRSKIASGLASQILPAIQNGSLIVTKNRAPWWEKQNNDEGLTVGINSDAENLISQDRDTKKILGGQSLQEKTCISVDQPYNWPHSVHGIVHAIFQKGSEFYDCFSSGTLIAPNLVLTAAQNLYVSDINEGQPIGRATKVNFYPGIKEEVFPFGEYIVRDFYFPEEYIEDKKENYGLLVLDKPVGRMTGYFGINILSPEQICELELNITGYPGDTTKDKLFQDELWTITIDQPTNVTQDFVYYQIDRSWGHNGSSVWYKDKDNNHSIIGVHGTGEDLSYGGAAILITQPRYEKMRMWVTESVLTPKNWTTFSEKFERVDSNRERKRK